MTTKLSHIEINQEFETVLGFIENTNNNLFLTGKAGTGKSTLLNYWRHTTAKNHVALAPTGVAALNIGGQTIHSFFKFGIENSPKKVKRLDKSKRGLLEKIETIVIDEASMVRADLLDSIDRSLRKNRSRPHAPFGGVQMILIGDPYQLSPIVNRAEKGYFSSNYPSPFFFSSRSYQLGSFTSYELSKIYRQTDPLFIELLNATRTGSITQDQLNQLNNQAEYEEEYSIDNKPVYLVTTNDRAREINSHYLNSISTDEESYNGIMTGQFRDRNLPTEEVLVLKTGAKVILLNNDRDGRWVNGDLGVIEELDSGSVFVRLENGRLHQVEPYIWEMINYTTDTKTNEIESEVIGTFEQIPLRLAWALTIHKSQGSSFSNMVIDLGHGAFADGQTYVALSRAKSLPGLFLSRPIRWQDIIVNKHVIAFMETVRPILE